MFGTIAIAIIALTGCTKAAAPTGSTSSVTTPTSSDSTSSAPASTQTTTSDSPTSSPTAAPSSHAATPTTPMTNAGPAACLTSALTVTVQRGSGAAGHQFANLIFANKSASTCSITGYPGVQLLLAGQPLAKPANRSGKAISRVDLAPNASGTALLTNDSTCNANNSDSVQVIVPNQTQKLVFPLRFRGCTLTIDPVVHS